VRTPRQWASSGEAAWRLPVLFSAQPEALAAAGGLPIAQVDVQRAGDRQAADAGSAGPTQKMHFQQSMASMMAADGGMSRGEAAATRGDRGTSSPVASPQAAALSAPALDPQGGPHAHHIESLMTANSQRN